MTPVPLAIQGVLALLVLTAAAYDIKYRRIPNWLNLFGVAAGLALNTAASGLSGLKMATLGLFVAFAVNLVFYIIHALGAGDVKLFAAIGALVGLVNWVLIFILTAIAGGVIAIVLIVVKRRTKKTLWNVAYLLGELLRFRAPYLTREELDVKSEKAMRLPRAVSIAAGTLVFLALLYYRNAA
jgi:prepilin peptidase CpaA